MPGCLTAEAQRKAPRRKAQGASADSRRPGRGCANTPGLAVPKAAGTLSVRSTVDQLRRCHPGEPVSAHSDFLSSPRG
jgi:hypothetical protein